MRVKPVRRYAAPTYPTRDYLLEHPELLQWLPQRWRRNPLVLKSLALMIPLILARPALADSTATSGTTLRVAPLFIHGRGFGSYGCLVVNPPVFLSEAEARQMVQDEAKKAGIGFTADGLTVKNALVPVTNPYEFFQEEKDRPADGTTPPPAPPKTKRNSLRLDGYNTKLKVAYEPKPVIVKADSVQEVTIVDEHAQEQKVQ